MSSKEFFTENSLLSFDYRQFTREKYLDKPEELNHFEAVSEKFSDPLEHMIAYLHDITEDDRCKIDDLRKEGLPEWGLTCLVILNRNAWTEVLPLTADSKVVYKEYIKNILNPKENPLIKVKMESEDWQKAVDLALRIKLIDLDVNMSRPSLGDLKDRYKNAKKILNTPKNA